MKPAVADAYPAVWVDRAELNLSVPQVIKGLIEEGNICAVYGEPGCGKSFFTADIGQHVATGQLWRGRKTKKSLVVYVASEAGSSIIKRFVAWRDHRLSDTSEPVPLVILTRGPDLGNLVDHQKLCEQLEALQAEAGLPLGLVIFDTLSRSMPGGDENSSEHMSKAISAADLIRDKFKAAIIFIHHSGKDPDKGMRGHSSFHGHCDVEILVERGKATVKKGRDIVGGEVFAFELEPIEIGLDCDGDPVITCLLNHSDDVKPAKRAEPTGKNQRIVMKEIQELAIEAEISPGTSEIPKGCRIVRFEALAKKAVPRFAGLEPFRARARVAEALSSLQASGLVGVHGELLWLL